MPTGILEPLWSAPAGIRALCTTRRGGVSTGSYADWNLGRGVGDVPERVERNQRRLRRATGGHRIQWLDQVHGVGVHRVLEAGPSVTADAAWTEAAGVALAVTVADCVPVVFCDASATIVGVAHCGWRGAVDGIVEATVATLPVAASVPCMPGLAPRSADAATRSVRRCANAPEAARPLARPAPGPGSSTCRSTWRAGCRRLASGKWPGRGSARGAMRVSTRIAGTESPGGSRPSSGSNARRRHRWGHRWGRALPRIVSPT